MCKTCGCLGPSLRGKKAKPHGHTLAHDHAHPHAEGAGHHHHDPETASGPNKRIEFGASVLEKNDRLAAANRKLFAKKKLLVLNLISSPGSGKTTLLEALARHYGDRMAVVVGDEQTCRDAERVIRAGSRSVQIETGGACHLDAHAVAHALEELDLEGVELLVIENVGNLICPAAYDLGEHLKMALLSVAEGDDKVLKYPSIFSRVGVLAITKLDLLPHLDFDVEKAVNECRSLNRSFEVFRLSAKTGEGMKPFFDFLAVARRKVVRRRG